MASAGANDHLIASYNVSWANSAGFHTGADPKHLLNEFGKPFFGRVSEYEFIKRAKKPFQFWGPALEHLDKFVRENNPSFIGIQEAGRTNEIKALPCFGSNYNFYESKQGFETLLTIWRKDLGIPAFEPINADSGVITGEVGRPIIGIFTTEGYLLINCHLPWGEDKGSRDKWFKRAQQEYLSSFIQPFFDAAAIDPSKIFIVGDFNYESYLSTNPLQLRQITLTGGNPAPAASCCHSYSKQKVANPAIHKEAYVRGNDYCFGQNVVVPLTVADSPVDALGGSIASDHELVYAIFRSSGSKGSSASSRRSKGSSASSRRSRRSKGSSASSKRSRRSKGSSASSRRSKGSSASSRRSRRSKGSSASSKRSRRSKGSSASSRRSRRSKGSRKMSNS